jgi:hypothetical protein
MTAPRQRAAILHPILFAAYPIIALLANNIEEIKVDVALRALLLSCIVGFILYSLLKYLLKDRVKAGISASAILVIFFSYGHLYNYLSAGNLITMTLGRHRYLAPASFLAGILIVGWVIRKTSNLQLINSTLNWIALAALLIPVYQIGSYEIRAREVHASLYEEEKRISALSLPVGQVPPDIYYIILDAYTRDDTLQADHNLDNSPFINQLREWGFFTARCSQSNYSQTQLSLASSLNMDYLHVLDDQYTTGNSSRVGIQDLIHNNLVRRALENLGYTTIAFETGFKGTQWEDADVYFAPGHGILERMQIAGRLNDFEVMLLETSAGLLITDASGLFPEFIQANLNNPRLIHRQRILYNIDKLHSLPIMPGPKFVFAHLVIPHPPYVFGPDGEFTDFDIDADIGYTNQIKYINDEFVKLIDDLISASEVPPIIIIQGDHGAIHSPPAKRLLILNTYFLPGFDSSDLNPKISPVNTFRLVFNQYFGGDYDMLEDKAFYSSYQYPYDLTLIPETRDGCD